MGGKGSTSVPMAGEQNPASVVKGNGDPLANHAVAQQRGGGGGVVSLQAGTLPACVFALLVQKNNPNRIMWLMLGSLYLHRILRQTGFGADDARLLEHHEGLCPEAYEV